MELNDYYSSHKSSSNEEEALLKRLIALKKQLDDDDDDDEDKPKLQRTLNNIKENIVTNKNIKSTSKFKYCKDNNHTANKFLSTKIDNRNFTNRQSKIKQNSLFVKTNNSSSKVYNKQNVLHFTAVKTVINKKNPEISNNTQNIIKYNSEINEILKNSIVNNCNLSSNETSCYETSDISQILHNVDKYMINVEDYLTSSKYVVDKEVNSSSAKKTNQSKNVHVNRKFQNQLISNNLLNSNLKNVPNSLASINKSTSINKKKIIKKLSGKIIGSPNLVKIGNTKLVRQSLFRNKWKINNKLNCIENNTTERKPLSTLQCPTLNTLIPYKKIEWTKVTNSTPVLKSKLSNSSNINKLKWTKPSILLVNNVKNNTHSSIPKADKLILFGKNKIIRQSLINPIQSKTKSYMLKHLSHRFALMRKLQQKNIVAKIKTVTNNEQVKNMLLKNTVIKPIEIKRNGKRSYSVYSYINPILRSKTNSIKLEKTRSTDNKIRLLNISNNKPQQNFKIINNEKNKIQNLSLTNNKTLQRLKSKKTLTKQLCLIFNRFGVCSKLNQGECDKRHYKKYIILCTKFLTGECLKENCTLSHNIVEEKIPFCKHYLNSVCVQLNCPYLHEYRSKNTPICKKFLDGSCNWGKKCPKKHLNLCPIFETKNECPHGQKCLYPHIQCEEKNTVVEINEPRYFEISIPNSNESNENESIHIVPKRRAPLLDLPSYIPLKKQ